MVMKPVQSACSSPSCSQRSDSGAAVCFTIPCRAGLLLAIARLNELDANMPLSGPFVSEWRLLLMYVELYNSTGQHPGRHALGLCRAKSMHVGGGSLHAHVTACNAL